MRRKVSLVGTPARRGLLKLDCPYLAARAAFTRSGVKGTSRILAPVASKIAFPTAAATTVIAVSPAPLASTSVRLMRTLSIRGTANPSGRLW